MDTFNTTKLMSTLNTQKLFQLDYQKTDTSPYLN